MNVMGLSAKLVAVLLVSAAVVSGLSLMVGADQTTARLELPQMHETAVPVDTSRIVPADPHYDLTNWNPKVGG